MRAGALASNAANADPIDVAFLHAAKDRKLADASAKTVSFEPFSPKTRHTEAVVEIGGKKTRVVKGALRTVAEAAGLDAAAIAALEKRADEQAQKGVRVLAVARADGDGPLRLLGLALLYDAPRPDSRRLIDELRSLGIKVLMLTGDALPVAREIARVLGLGDIKLAPKRDAAQKDAPEVAPDLAGGGLAEVFPEDKFLVVKSLQAAGHVVGMTGDGVNDAPALKLETIVGNSGASIMVAESRSHVVSPDWAPAADDRNAADPEDRFQGICWLRSSSDLNDDRMTVVPLFDTYMMVDWSGGEAGRGGRAFPGRRAGAPPAPGVTRPAFVHVTCVYARVYAAVYVVARFCPLALSFFFARPSWSTRGISLLCILSAARICSARRPSFLLFTSATT